VKGEREGAREREKRRERDRGDRERARERARERSQALRERHRARARERGGERDIASVPERGDGVRDCVTDFEGNENLSFLISFIACPSPHTQTHPNYANHLAIENRNLGTILDEHSVACEGKKKKTRSRHDASRTLLHVHSTLPREYLHACFLRPYSCTEPAVSTHVRGRSYTSGTACVCLCMCVCVCVLACVCVFVCGGLIYHAYTC
jgi:hypothetical protein